MLATLPAENGVGALCPSDSLTLRTLALGPPTILQTAAMAPSTPLLSVLIVGGGYSGIAAAIELQTQLGPSRVSIRVVEKADGPGGIWKSSTWPGAGVDIPIHLYSLGRAPRHDWRTVFASQAEVLDYLERLIDDHSQSAAGPVLRTSSSTQANALFLLARHVDLGSNFSYNTEYVSSSWDADKQQHVVTVRPSDSSGTAYTLSANVLISANGPLSTPLIPRIPGLDAFQGISFHNLRWRSDVDLSGKRIAVVGNGSSGIQLLPGLAELEGTEIVQYIRSGGYFFPKVNTEIGEGWRWVFKWVPGARWTHRAKLFFEVSREIR